MPQILCTECTWSGDSDEALNDDEHILSCPDCGASTDDDHSQWADPDDLTDTYGS